MDREQYIEIELGDQTYMVAPEGTFTGDESRRDIRVLSPGEVSDFEIGIEQAGTRVGVDPSQYDSLTQMYQDAVEKAQEMGSEEAFDELFADEPLENDSDEESDADPIEALDMYGGKQ